MHVFLLVVVIVHHLVGESCRAQSTTPTLCDTQLHTYYVQKGLSPSYPVLPLINYTTGTLFDGTPFVTASYNMQLAAQQYQANISNNTGPVPEVVYISFDLPWCATDVQIHCSTYSQHAMGKVCENILDIDTGPPSQIEGRFFVYVNQSSPCNGICNVTFINTTLLGTYTADIVYDGSGITNLTTLAFDAAQFKYRYTECLYSDGTNTTWLFLQGQFACAAQTIGCNTIRPSSSSSRRLPVPAPRYACTANNVTYSGVNNTPTINSQYIVWHVYSFQPTGGSEGLFRIDFIGPDTLQSYYDGVYNPFNNALCGFIDFLNFFLSLFNLPLIYRGPCIKQILVPSTRRQFKVQGQNFNSYMLINSGSGDVENWFTTVVTPSYPFSKDKIIEIIPCICQFSIDCKSDGEIDLNNLYHYINPNNQRPIAAVFGRRSITIPAGQPNISLNANASTDPDNGPLGLSYYWKSYNISRYVQSPTSGIPIIPIDNVTAQKTYAQTGALLPGLYMVVLYVSDGQAVSFTLFNFTVACNVITALTGNNFVVEHQPCTATQPSVCVPLNGTTTSQTGNYTLYYNWTLLWGWPLSPTTYSTACSDYTRAFFNTSQAVSCFIPQFLGIYQFQLTVTDNLCTTSTSTIFVNVVLPGSNVSDFNNSYDTFPPVGLTNPPIGRPVIGFPTTPSVPVTLAPFAPSTRPYVNTTVAGPPSYGAPTTSQWISLLTMVMVAALFIVMFFGLWIAMMPMNETNYLDRIRYYQH